VDVSLGLALLLGVQVVLARLLSRLCFSEFSVLSVVWFVSGQHDVDDGQNLAGDGDDGFAGSMLLLDPHVEFSQSGVVLSGGLSALAEDPSCSLRAFFG
jgi:hypothetical protein